MSNKVINIPDLPAGTPPELVNYLTAVSEALNLLQGLGRTSDMDRAMRLGEIQKLGISIPVFQGASLEEPAAQTPSGRSPHSPTDLVVTPGTFAHKITLTVPDDDIIQYIEVWSAINSQNRSEASRRFVYTPVLKDYGQSVEMAIPIPDPTDDYTYWCRSVSFAGNRSAWHPSDSIGGYVVPGDEALAETIDNVIEALRGGNPDPYAADTEYSFNDRCMDTAGRVWKYINLTPGSGNAPPDSDYWERVGILMQGDVDGQPTVAIDGNLVVDDTILARCIKAGEITADHIAAAQLLIGHTIKSSDFVEATTGWIIEGRSGQTTRMQINGGILEINGQALTSRHPGLVNYNPGGDVLASGGLPDGWYSFYNTSTNESYSYDATEEALVIEDDSNQIGITGMAFPVVEGASYQLKIRLRAETSQTSGLYIRVNEYDSELPNGKLAIGATSGTDPSEVQTGDREVSWNSSPDFENVAVSDSYSDYEATYTPTSTAKYASVCIYKWTGIGTQNLYVKYCKVVSNATDDSDIRHSSDATKIDGGKIYTGTIVADAIAAGTITGSKISGTELSAVKTNTGSLSVSGNLVMGNSGRIYSSGKSTYASSADGVFLGYDTTEGHSFKVGSGNDCLSWCSSDGISYAGPVNGIAAGDVPHWWGKEIYMLPDRVKDTWYNLLYIRIGRGGTHRIKFSVMGEHSEMKTWIRLVRNSTNVATAYQNNATFSTSLDSLTEHSKDITFSSGDLLQFEIKFEWRWTQYTGNWDVALIRPRLCAAVPYESNAYWVHSSAKEDLIGTAIPEFPPNGNN